MACKYLGEDGNCKHPADDNLDIPERVCSEWLKWDGGERDYVDTSFDTFCRDDKYKDRWPE